MSRKKYILYMRWISVEILLTFRKVKVGKGCGSWEYERSVDKCLERFRIEPE
jgi:hypothetical protein